MGIEFVLTSLVLAVTPGTGVLYTVTTGLGRGARTGPWSAAAVRTHVLTRPQVLTLVAAHVRRRLRRPGRQARHG